MDEEFQRAGKTNLLNCLLLFVLQVRQPGILHPADCLVCVRGNPSSVPCVPSCHLCCLTNQQKINLEIIQYCRELQKAEIEAVLEFG